MDFLNLFVIALFLIVFFRTIEVILFDKNRKQGKIYAGWTLTIFTISYVFLILSTILEYIIVRRQINLFISGIAIGIMVIRFLTKYWAFKSLGEYYSSNIEIRETHKLIKTGPYRHIRNPAYLSNLLDYIAVPLFVNSFYTIFWIFPLQTLLIYIRIRFEEKALTGKFGEEYIKYKSETGSLIPLLYTHERKD